MNNVINKNTHITLWGLKISPYVRKVIVALEEKSLDYTLVEILPKSLLLATNQSVPTDFDEASPLGKIPAIQVGDFAISDSAVIAEFLDQLDLNTHNLYPTDLKSAQKLYGLKSMLIIY
ncbi:glutathione S-transferase family protein [Gammaproteobacteria bacterium]|nr:glutathione S-transferase family protein [Gammaproteobacteria bacterium]